MVIVSSRYTGSRNFINVLQLMSSGENMTGPGSLMKIFLYRKVLAVFIYVIEFAGFKLLKF